MFNAWGHVSADHAELEDCIRCLGLQSIRARRLIALSAAYLGQHGEPGSQNRRHPSTPISHLPGSGPYALDSYRIYCGGSDAWRTVVPRDKELIRFIVRLFSPCGQTDISDI
jgi:methyl-CpG-binding domain protein 4